MGYGRIEHVMSALEAVLSQSNYLAGDDFTAADLYVGSALGFGMMFGTIEKRPAFERYWQLLSARPACKRAKELDDALTPPRPAAGS
jgi:glutathione S-transferase